MIACRNMEELMGVGWENEEACLEIIGFWTGQFTSRRFSLCLKPLRLWRNLARLQSVFVKQRKLMCSQEEFGEMLRGVKAQQLLRLANYWLGQQHYARLATSGALAVMASPSESLRQLKRKLAGRVCEAT